MGAEEAALTEARLAAANALWAQFRADRHRPRYHFVPAGGWMNDINGALWWRGRYHVFYQHHPDGAFWHRIQWGHASSVDLVHWVHHPIALTPDDAGPDRDGCFSGSAFLDRDGRPTLIYHGVPDGTCLATAADDLLLHWTKHPANPVIATPRAGDDGFGVYGVYDPCAWLHDGRYYAAQGNVTFRSPMLLDNDHEPYRDPLGRPLSPADEGDTLYLFRSDDLVRWEYVGHLYQSDRRWTERHEDCAVPEFFALGDRWMLLFASHLQSTQYYLGRLDGERFLPEVHGRMGWPGGVLGGPRSLLDAQGRRIFFDWIRELRGTDDERASGWSGVMTLPRVLSLAADGSLLIEPAPELAALRLGARRWVDLGLPAQGELRLDGVHSDSFELHLVVPPSDATELGLKVRCSPDGAEQTVVTCDRAAGTLSVDVSRSSLDARIRYRYYRFEGPLARRPETERDCPRQVAPLRLGAAEPLDLRVFVDRSVIEVYANRRQCLTQRVYPTREDSLGVALFSRGGPAVVARLDLCELAPANHA